MKMTQKTKKCLSILLCVLMLVQSFPMAVFAADEDAGCTHHAVHTEECGYAAAVAEVACTHVHDEACGYVEAVAEVLCACTDTDENGALVHTADCGYVAPVAGADCTHVHDELCGYAAAVEEQACQFVCTECSAETPEETPAVTPEETPMPEETPVPEETPAPTPEAAVEPQTTQALSLVVPNVDLPDNSELFAYYVDGKLYGYEMATFGTQARATLNDAEKAIYDILKPKIQAVAANGGSSVFSLGTVNGLNTTFTAAELGLSQFTESNIQAALSGAMAAQVDQQKIITALLTDCPFDLYWFDKTQGAGMGFGISYYPHEATATDLYFLFKVSADYGNGETTVSSDVAKITAAAANAQAVVNANAGKSAYEKMVAYKEYICGAVSYNSTAADDSYAGGYGAPWQLINVFDGDSSTNVVCEGYSKAFQYLCDLGGVDCISVSGTMYGGTGAGSHMWNVVTLDGKNYLVDVTNCDAGTIGAPDNLFLRGAVYANGGYTIPIGSQNIVYVCSNHNLATEDYSVPAPAVTYSVTIDPDIENGAVLTDKTTAKEGDSVTIAVVPDAGYLLESLTYQIGTDVIKLGANVGGGNCRFTMPAGDITINAVFVRCNHSLGENSTCSKCRMALVAKANSTYFSSADELYAYLAQGETFHIELLGEWNTFAPKFNSDVTVTLSGSVKHITVNSEHIVQLTLNTSSVESIALEQGKLILNVADFTNLHKLDLTVTDKNAPLTVTLSNSNYRLYQTDSGNELPLGEPVAAGNYFIHHKTFGTPDAHNWTSEGNFFHTFTCSECGAIRTETYSWEIDFCDICNEGRPHNIVISDTITNGTVTADKAAASVNEIVTLTVTPDSGYLQSSLEAYYTDNRGSGADDVSLAADYSVTLTPVEGQTGKYTFVMPAAEVNVVASFSKCDHKDSKHTTAESKNNGGHIITCTVCKGTYDEFCTFNNEYKCILCGYDCDHDNRSMQTVEATCVATGTRTDVCLNCGKILGQEILPINPDNHGEMDSSTGLCSYGCGTSLAVATATVGGTTTYYSTLPAALDAVGSAAAADNATVRLLKDAELNRKVTLSTGVFTLDLNGKTLTETYDYFYLDIAGGDVTLLSSVAGGKISQPYNGNAITVTDGKLTIGANTTIEYSGDNYSGQTLRMNGGHVVLNGGTLSVADGIIGAVPVVINDGTFTLTAGTIKSSASTVAIEIEGGILNLNGGSIAAPNYSAISALGGTLNIGGTSIIHGSRAYDIRCFHPTTLLAVLNFTNAAGTEYTVDIVSSSQPLPVENLIYDSTRHSLSSTDSNLTDGYFAKDSVATLSCAHPTSTATANNDGTHKVTCNVCSGTVKEAEACYGGKATCKQLAECEACGASYGELSETHSYNEITGICTECGLAKKYTADIFEIGSVDGLPVLTNPTAVHGQEYTTTVFSGNSDAWYCDVVKVTVNDIELVKGTDYTFNVNFGKLTVNADKVSGNMKIYAQVNAKVTFDMNGGDMVDQFKQELIAAGGSIVDGKFTIPMAYGVASSFGTDVNTLNQRFIRTGYTCTGLKNGENDANLNAPLKNCELVLQWTPNTYNAVFNANGGVWEDNVTSKSVPTAYEAAITAPADPTRTGYTFTGWSPAVGSMDTAADKTFTAQWKINSYTITFYDEIGLIEEETVTVEYGSDITSDMAPKTTSEHFKLRHWIDEDSNPVTFPFSMPAHDMKLCAVHDGKRYEAQVRLNNGEADETVSYIFGDPAYNLEPMLDSITLAHTGYTFAGWELKDGNTNKTYPHEDDRLITDKLIIDALWTPNTYTVTWNVDGNTSTTTQTYDKKLVLPAETPAKVGYFFDGWFTAKENGTPVDSSTVYQIADNTTYYAVFTACEHSDPTKHVCSYYSDTAHSIFCTNCQAALTEPVAHTFVYRGSGNVITVSCEVCSSENLGTASLTAANKNYDGNAYTAEVTKTKALSDTAITVTYDAADNDTNLTDGKAVLPGKYSAVITLGDSSASAEFEITIPEAVLTPAAPNPFGWYKVAELYAPDGYSISLIENGTFGTNISLSDGEYTALDYWLKPSANSSALPVKMTADRGIKVDGTMPQIFTAKATSITDSTATVTVDATDILSGVHTISLVCSDDTVTISPSENGEFSISGMQPNTYYSFTVYVEDYAGNSNSYGFGLTTEKAASVVTAAPTPNTLTYNGEKQNLFNGGEASGGRMIYSFKQNGTYTETILQKQDAGTYTVWYMVAGDENHLDTEPESITVTIAKADDYIGTVTASDVENTLELSAITIVRSDSTVDGTLALDAGQQLQLGDNKLTYTFTPDDTANYEVLTGEVIVNVKDTAAPTVEVKLGENTRTDLVSPVSFNLYSNVSLTANVTASDAFTGIAKVEYFIASEEMTRSALEALSADSWSELINSSEITIPAVDGAAAVCYVRAADKAGNVTYVSTDGMVFDLTAPVIKGVEDGETRYTTTTVSAEDKNLDKMFINDIKVPNPIAIEGDQNQTFVIKATDKAGNETTVTVTMKPIAELAKPMEDLTDSNVTSDNEPILEDIIQEVEELLKDKTLPADEKKALNDIKDDAEDLLDAVNDAQDAVDTDAVNDTLDITSENVETEDKETLEQAKEDLEQALEDYGDNYTDEEREIIEDAIDRIDEALDSIEDVEAVEELIDRLPETAEADDPDTRDEVLAAKAEYDALSDHEKTMVDEDTAKKLNKLVDMVTYKIVKGNGSKWTVGSDNSLRFTANGAFSRFAAVKVDGNTLNTKYYEAKEGSTIITLKTDFLDTLKTGKHTIEVVYTDGSANGTFTVTVNPATGDTSNVGLWAGLFGLSLAALTVTAILYRRKRDDR